MTIDENELKNSIQLHQNLNSYTFTFTRDEIYDYISDNGYKRKNFIFKM